MMKSMGEIRKFNTRNYILNIIRTRKKASKFQIQKISKYSMTTILSTIDELVDSGLILPAGKGDSNGGRRPDFYEINPQGGYYIGVEFNIELIHAAVIDFSGCTVQTVRIVLEPDDLSAECLMNRIVNLIDDLSQPLKARGARIMGIGIGVPGRVDNKSGVAVQYLRLPDWHNIAVRSIIESHFGVHAYLDTNINSIAFFYKWSGSNQACSDFVLFSIRKGVRVVCFMKNELLRGSHNSVGEIGHTPVRLNGRLCVCGRKGCLDAEAADDAIRDKLLEGIQSGRFQDLFDSVGQDPTRVNVSSFVESVLAGHPDSMELLDEVCGYLSLNLAHVVNLYNPSRICIYGEITRIGEPFLERIRRMVSQMAMEINVAELEIVLASLEHEAGAIGAALMALQRMYPAVNIDDLYQIKQTLPQVPSSSPRPGHPGRSTV